VLLDEGAWTQGPPSGTAGLIGGQESDGRPLYICRATVTVDGINHGTASGKLVGSACFIPYGGRELRFSSYSLFYEELATAAAAIPYANMRNLGMVSIKSVYGYYLQVYTDGELHASNPKINEEETWFLIEVNPKNHIYALRNWRPGKLLSKRTNGCAPAVAVIMSPPEMWVLVSGDKFGAPNAVAFRNLVDGTYLGANKPADDTACGGEVMAGSVAPPPQYYSGWPGWWVPEPATQPSPGKDLWNTIGNGVLEPV
jgi:hypothetical protein